MVRRCDELKYDNDECFVHGLRSSGYFDTTEEKKLMEII